MSDISRFMSDISRFMSDISRFMSDISRFMSDISRFMLNIRRFMSDVSTCRLMLNIRSINYVQNMGIYGGINNNISILHCF